MRLGWIRFGIGLLVSYCALSALAGCFILEASLHPQRRALTGEDADAARDLARRTDSTLELVVLLGRHGERLEAWSIRPRRENGNAVLLLHGLGDNRMGMLRPADYLLRDGYSVLLPDARAHGNSGGQMTTFGLLEAADIHDWVDWLEANDKPKCVYALGESMGAAQLLQSLSVEKRFCAVVAEASFANFREISYDRIGQFTDTGPWLGRTLLRPVVTSAFVYARLRYGLSFDRLSPEDGVRNSTIPVALIHGQLDGNIPPRHSQRIARLNPRVVLTEVPGAGHCQGIGSSQADFEQRVVSRFTGKDPPETSARSSQEMDARRK